MIRRLKKYIVLGLLLNTLIGVTGCQLNKSIAESKEKNYTKVTIISEDNKLLEKESVVQAVNELCNLEVLQVQLSKEISLKQGKYFTKEKNIKFYANCKYILDLNKISGENVLINGNEITIFCTAPMMDISIQEDMTEFSDTKKSFLTFGDLEMSSEEYNSILTEIKISFISEFENYGDEAKVKSENSIERVLSVLTKNNYNIDVRWVEQ